MKEMLKYKINIFRESLEVFRKINKINNCNTTINVIYVCICKDVCLVYAWDARRICRFQGIYIVLLCYHYGIVKGTYVYAKMYA